MGKIFYYGNFKISMSMENRLKSQSENLERFSYYSFVAFMLLFVFGVSNESQVMYTTSFVVGFLMLISTSAYKFAEEKSDWYLPISFISAAVIYLLTVYVYNSFGGQLNYPFKVGVNFSPKNQLLMLLIFSGVPLLAVKAKYLSKKLSD